MIQRTETEHTIQFELCRGTKLQFNKNGMTEVGMALDYLCRLEKAFRNIMPMETEKIVEIMDAHEDGRLTIWPRTGQEVWFDATGMCERCPVLGTEECKRPEEAKLGFGDPDTCPPYVSSENWLGDTDVDQKLAFLEGAYYMSEDEAIGALMKKGES